MSDYSRLKYNVNSIPHTESILKSFPVLEHLESWKAYKKKDPDKLFRYAILLYDAKSPLIREIPRLSSRKDKAANQAGYIRTDSGDWPKFVQEIMNWENQEANLVFLDYLKQQNEMKWAQRVAMEETFWENVELMSIQLKIKEEVEGGKSIDKTIKTSQDTKSKLSDINKKLLADIEELDRELFMDDSQAKDHFNKLRGTSPENVAKMRREIYA